MKNSDLTMDGFDFSFDPGMCSGCDGRCCCGESGYIWLAPDDIKAIAEYLSIGIDDFTGKYTRDVSGRRSLIELKIKGNWLCVFYDTGKNCCSIYSVRPGQCRTFPFWDYFRGRPGLAARECPGVKPRDPV